MSVLICSHREKNKIFNFYLSVKWVNHYLTNELRFFIPNDRTKIRWKSQVSFFSEKLLASYFMKHFPKSFIHHFQIALMIYWTYRSVEEIHTLLYQKNMIFVWISSIHRPQWIYSVDFIFSISWNISYMIHNLNNFSSTEVYSFYSFGLNDEIWIKMVLSKWCVSDFVEWDIIFHLTLSFTWMKCIYSFL